MEKILNIGIVIADKDEYSPIMPYVEKYGGEAADIFGLTGHKFTMPINGGSCVVHSLLCGTGKVNAAAGAAFLIDRGADIIINTGLSGGISGVTRGDIVLATTLSEHDFNLMCLGYKLGEKPGQDYIYNASDMLNNHFTNIYPEIKCGAMVTGDCFVSDAELRDKLKSEFGAVACDMESAAVAYICHIANLPFVALRRISDDAGNDATTDYRSMNSLAESCLMDIVLKGILSLEAHKFK